MHVRFTFSNMHYIKNITQRCNAHHDIILVSKKNAANIAFIFNNFVKYKIILFFLAECCIIGVNQTTLIMKSKYIQDSGQKLQYGFQWCVRRIYRLDRAKYSQF